MCLKTLRINNVIDSLDVLNSEQEEIVIYLKFLC